MKKQTEGIAEKILECAVKEFLEKGFLETNLREIALKCNVSTHPIYIRFESKEGLFDAAVKKTIEDIEELKKMYYKKNYALLDENSLMDIWKDPVHVYQKWISYFYERYEGMKLLLCCSKGTKYENFFENYVEENTEVCMEFMKAAREKGISHNTITEREMRILLTAYWITIFDPIIHDYSYEEALEHCKLLSGFFNWRFIFGF